MQYDKEFLNKIKKEKNKIIYAKVIALSSDELPLEELEGKITQGSINCDGSSAIRRSCSLTFVAQNLEYHSYYWSLKTKFQFFIGIENFIDDAYPRICWFNQGIYVISSFSCQKSISNFTISITGKDKMCLLNGEMGGTLTSSVDFGTIEEEQGDITNIKHLLVKDIIRNIVHQFGREPYENIIINDLDELALELLEYRYDIPMYLYRDKNSNIFKNILFDGNVPCQIEGKPNITKLEDLTTDELEILSDYFMGTNNPDIVIMDGKEYYVSKILFGQTGGYRTTDLTYAGELLAAAGDSITSILDKIKNMLTEYEYFYDVLGKFVFQKKDSYKNTYNILNENLEEFITDNFSTTIGINYDLQLLKNDYAIWGQRLTTGGVEVPIYLRYAFDVKPIGYTSLTVTEEEIKNYGVEVKPQKSINYFSKEIYEVIDESNIYCDWREVIYQMASDYFKFNFLEDFEMRVSKTNPILFPFGKTGYEQYYTDIQGFWRQLYNPEEGENYISFGDNKCWNKDIIDNPELLNFWFDFIQSDREFSEFNIKNIGIRTKVENSSNVKGIAFKKTPSVIFTKNILEEEKNSAYKYIQIPNIEAMFSISSQGKSAFDRLEELVYKHGYCAETVTLQTIPIYHLEPNTSIYIYDNDTNIEGRYIINRISIPLTYNGTMSITATKAASEIFKGGIINEMH